MTDKIDWHFIGLSRSRLNTELFTKYIESKYCAIHSETRVYWKFRHYRVKFLNCCDFFNHYDISLLVYFESWNLALSFPESVISRHITLIKWIIYDLLWQKIRITGEFIISVLCHYMVWLWSGMIFSFISL